MTFFCQLVTAQTSNNRILINDKESFDFEMPEAPINDYYRNYFANLGTDIINYELSPTVEIDGKTYIAKYQISKPFDKIITVEVKNTESVEIAIFKRIRGLYSVRYVTNISKTNFKLTDGNLKLEFIGDFQLDNDSCDIRLFQLQSGKFEMLDAFSLYETQKKYCESNMRPATSEQRPNSEKIDISVELNLQAVSQKDYQTISSDFQQSREPFLKQYAKFTRNRELQTLKNQAFNAKKYVEALQLSKLIREENINEVSVESWVIDYLANYSFDIQCLIGLKRYSEVIEIFMGKYYFVKGAEELSNRGISFAGDMLNQGIFLDTLTRIVGRKRANQLISNLYKNLKEVTAEKQERYDFTFLGKRYVYFPKAVNLEQHPITQLAFQANLQMIYGNSMGEISGTFDGKPFKWNVILPNIYTVNTYQTFLRQENMKDIVFLKENGSFFIPMGVAYENPSNYINFASIVFTPNPTEENNDAVLQMRFRTDGKIDNSASDIYYNHPLDKMCVAKVTSFKNGIVEGFFKGNLRSVTNSQNLKTINVRFRFKLYDIGK